VRRKRLSAAILAACLAAAASAAWAAAPAEPAAPPPARQGDAVASPAETGEGNEELGVAPRAEAPFNLGTSEYDRGHLLWESLAAVLVILALGGLALFVMRRLVPRITAGRAKRIAVIETVHLAPQRSVHLVQVGSRSLLVGAGRDSLCLLADVTGALPLEPAQPPKARFVIPADPAHPDEQAQNVPPGRAKP